MAIIFRRLNDEQVENRCFDLLIFLLNEDDPHIKVLIKKEVKIKKK